MYQLRDDRRITKFVKSEARKWLLKNIDGYNYTGKAQTLYETITKAREISESMYGEFLKVFDNNPINRKLKGLSEDNKGIESNDIHKYFIRYNNHDLPIGFIIEFFEDDYDEKGKIDNLIKSFLDDSKESAKASWASNRFRFLREIQEKKKSLKNIYDGASVKIYVKYAVKI